jgi:hypothetical protein
MGHLETPVDLWAGKHDILTSMRASHPVSGAFVRTITIHNERVKLTATYMNAAASAVLAIGVLTPIAAAAFYASVRSGAAILGGLIALVVSVLLHMFARTSLGDLQ